MRALRLLLLLLAGMAGASTAAPAELRPFVAGSYAAIAQAHAGRPFLLVFWSMDCPPCHEELAMLGDLRRERDFDLVVVATDGADAAGSAAGVLEEKGLGEAEAWVFADPFVRRLRHEVDPRWYGELPRSYLFGAGGQREPVSGRLRRARVEAWLDGGTGSLDR